MNKDYYIDDSPALDIDVLLDLLDRQNIRYITNNGTFRKLELMIEEVRDKFIRCFTFSDSACLAKIEAELIFYLKEGAKTTKDLKDIYMAHAFPESRDMNDDGSELLDNFLKGYKINEGSCDS